MDPTAERGDDQPDPAEPRQDNGATEHIVQQTSPSLNPQFETDNPPSSTANHDIPDTNGATDAVSALPQQQAQLAEEQDLTPDVRVPFPCVLKHRRRRR